MALTTFANGRNEVPAKMYFSTTPFTSSSTGAKTSFKSSDYIYGRFELDKGTIGEVFKLKPTDKMPFLDLTVTIYKNDEQTGSEQGSLNHILLKPEDLSHNYFNFDVLPDPDKSTSIFSALDDFSAGLGFFPLYNLVQPEVFPETGTYKVELQYYVETKDAWGNDQDREKWPIVKGSFDLNFNENDITKLQDNKTKVKDATRENAFRYDKLPDVFSNPGPLTDPNATSAKIAAILKRDLPDRTILKFAAEKVSGLQWNIAKDDIDIPKYKYFTPNIWVAYKADNGKCYVGTVTLRENYQGGGTYGPLQVAFTSASEQADRGIDCVKVK